MLDTVIGLTIATFFILLIAVHFIVAALNRRSRARYWKRYPNSPSILIDCQTGKGYRNPNQFPEDKE